MLENLVSRETGYTVPSRVNLLMLHTQAESGGWKLAYNNAIRVFSSSNSDVITYKQVYLCIIPTAEGITRRALVKEYLDHPHPEEMMYIYTYVRFYMRSFTLLPETMARFSFG